MAGKLRVGQACDACRKRKIRCDGVRPVCSSCGRRGVRCIFQESRNVVAKASIINDRLRWIMRASSQIMETSQDYMLDLEIPADWKSSRSESTLFYKFGDILCGTDPVFKPPGQPNVLNSLMFQCATASKRYLDLIRHLMQVNVRLTESQEQLVRLRWRDLYDHAPESLGPISRIYLVLLGRDDLDDMSINREARYMCTSSIMLSLVNLGVEKNFRSFSLSFSQAQLTLESCDKIQPEPSHFLAGIFVLMATNICGFPSQLRVIAEVCRKMAFKLGLHCPEVFEGMQPDLAERLKTACWVLFYYYTDLACLTRNEPWRLSAIETPLPVNEAVEASIVRRFANLIKLYEPIYSLNIESDSDVSHNIAEAVEEVNRQLDAWSLNLPELGGTDLDVKPELFLRLRLHLTFCTFKCLLWSKLAFVYRNPHAARICEECARRNIVVCYEHANILTKHGLMPFHADFAYGIMLLNGIFFPHRRWIYLDIQLMKHTTLAISEFAFPLLAAELNRRWNLRMEILEKALALCADSQDPK